MIRRQFNQAVTMVKQKWEPKDVIALVALVICGVLLIMGRDHEITWTFSAIIAAYIGVDIIVNRRK